MPAGSHCRRPLESQTIEESLLPTTNLDQRRIGQADLHRTFLWPCVPLFSQTRLSSSVGGFPVLKCPRCPDKPGSISQFQRDFAEVEEHPFLPPFCVPPWKQHEHKHGSQSQEAYPYQQAKAPGDEAHNPWQCYLKRCPKAKDCTYRARTSR
jgi:hypothetical protein